MLWGRFSVEGTVVMVRNEKERMQPSQPSTSLSAQDLYPRQHLFKKKRLTQLQALPLCTLTSILHHFLKIQTSVRSVWKITHNSGNTQLSNSWSL